MEITPLRYNDLEFFHSVRHHPETLPFLHDQRAFTLEQVKDWYLSASPLHRIILVNGERVGYVRLSEIDKRHGNFCLGVDIAVEHRRKGYARQAYHLILDEFKASGYHRAWLEVLPSNQRAIDLYASLGFVQFGYAHESVKNTDANGNEVRSDSMFMELLLRNWKWADR